MQFRCVWSRKCSSRLVQRRSYQRRAGDVLALKSDGTVVAWGGGLATDVPADLSNVVAVAAGRYHSLALKNDGTVVAWAFGLATNVPSGLNNVVAVAAGWQHSLAVKNDGTVVAWGSGTATNVPAGLETLWQLLQETVPVWRSKATALLLGGPARERMFQPG